MPEPMKPSWFTTRLSDIEVQSSGINWKEFEELVENIFRSFGYRTLRNYRLRRPNAEIDLFAARSRTAFVVDCKHWKRTVGRATMLRISERQVKRAERIIKLEDVERVVPIILTLHEEFLNILENGTPIVPIHKISDFILNWESSKEIRVISK